MQHSSKIQVAEDEAEVASTAHSAAKQAYVSLLTRPQEWREAQLRAVKAMLADEEANIVDALKKDLGKPEFEAVYCEISLLRNTCDYMLRHLGSLMAGVAAKLPWYWNKSTAQLVPEPYGAVLVIAPWNYPVLLSLDPLIAAIAAGNSVVLKPSELASASAALLAQIVPKYLDSRAVKVVIGGASVAGALLELPWDKIFYTGSPHVGRVIMAAAARHLTPVTLELGGKSPVLVHSSADVAIAARRVATCKWSLNAGQSCIAPDYVIVERSVSAAFVDALVASLHRFGIDDLGETDSARIVNEDHRRRLQQMLDEAISRGAKEVKWRSGGKEDNGGDRRINLYMRPKILLNPPLDSEVMTDEIFGPILPVVEVDSILEEGLSTVKARGRPLAVYLFCGGAEGARVEAEVAARTSSGALLVNDVGSHVTLESVPFGGVGESGMGTYHGRFSFDTFSHVKPVVRVVGPDSALRYPPYSEKAEALLTALLRHRNWRFIVTALGLRKPSRSKL